MTLSLSLNGKNLAFPMLSFLICKLRLKKKILLADGRIILEHVEQSYKYGRSK